MERMLIWTGDEEYEIEYQTYSGPMLIGGIWIDGEWINHVEDGEVLLAVL